MKKQRRIDPQGKIDMVVTAARKLFVERGYYSVSIPAIVEASGVSIGTIYNHFVNKEGLARHIHEATLAQFKEAFAARLEGVEGTEQRLRVFADLVFEITEADPARMEYMLFMKHGGALKDAPPLCFTSPFRWVQQIVVEGMEGGVVKPGDYFISALSYTGVILRAAELRLVCVLERPLAEIADEVVANAWAAIRA